MVPLVLLAGLGLRGVLVDCLKPLTEALADGSFLALWCQTGSGHRPDHSFRRDPGAARGPSGE